jgi:DNA (cytosine-5)-methyltransferase 1
MEKTILTLASLFDGIGGFPYAASFYGIRPLWASEIVPECISVTKRHFPDMAHMGDITQLHGGTLPPVDIITFGSPCQGLSLAGQRRGLADERSGLFMEAVRIIYEMREATNGRYPSFAIWENVPGCTSSAHGRDFASVLSALTKSEVPMPQSGKWANAGMVRGGGIDLAWVIYDSQHFGTAQRRRRLFLVCDFGGKRAGEILFVPKSLRRYFEAGGTPRQGLAAFAESSADESGGFVEVLNDQGGSSMTVERFGLSPTLRNQTYGNLPIVAGPLCMGTGQANAGILYDQSPTLTAAHEYPFLVHPQLAGTLCASGAGLSRPAGMRSELDFCVASAGFRYKAASTAGSVGYQEETAPTLVAGQPSGVLKAFSIGAYYSKGMLSDNPAAGIRETDTSRTLDLNGGNPCCQQGGIAVVNAVDCRNLRETAEISGTLQAKTKSGGYSLNYQNPIHIGFCVRRLTPLEAERLMGFPDFWTEYGHDDKPISDTKRYSMLGNSIAVPCVAYIMQGIRDVLLREKR